jgi:8-oxo-dGTP pyrophosphatase MutT (NUDIX family)
MSAHDPSPLATLPAVAPCRRGVVAVIVRRDKLLVIQRSRWVAAPGAFCFPGGGIEPGESEEVAIVRELREELAIVARPVARLWDCVTARGVHLAWWRAELHAAAEPTPNPAEVEQVFWQSAEELRSLPGLLDSNMAFLDALSRNEFSLDELSLDEYSASADRKSSSSPRGRGPG